MANTTFDNVKIIKYWTQKVIPLVYDNSLSIYELIGKVIDRLNAIIENTNNLPEYIAEMIREYISSGAIETVVREILANYILNVKYPPTSITPAVGDGTADDTAAVQGCIDWASNQGGGAVYLPSGSYSVQELTLPSNVSLFGFDRYSTKMVLRGGATKPMISSVGTNFSISRLTLDGNMGIQVNNINILSLISQDVLLEDLIVQNGYKLFVYNGTGGHLQVDKIIFGSAVIDCVEISGGSSVQFKNCQFTNLSQVSGTHIIDISSDGGEYDFINNAVCPTCCIVSGNDNFIQFTSSGAQNNFNDTGLRNNIIVNGQEIKEYLSADFDSTIEGSYGQNVNGVYSENISGAWSSVRNSTENKIVTGKSTSNYNNGKEDNITGNNSSNTTGDNTISANNIILKPTNLLQFQRETDHYAMLADLDKTKYYVPTYENIDNLVIDKILKSNDIDLEWLCDFNYIPATGTQSSHSFQGSAFDGANLYIIETITDGTNYINKIDVNGNLILKSQILNLGHGNSMCYIKTLNLLAVAMLNVNGIALINPDTLTIDDTKLNTEPFSAIAYDEISNQIITRYGLNMNIYDTNFTLLKTFTLNEPSILLYSYDNQPTKLARQDIGYYNNIIFSLTYFPATIQVYNENGILLKVFNPFNNYNGFYMGETESINFVNGIAYISCNIHDNYGGQYTGRFFTYNPLENSVTQPLYGIASTSAFTSGNIYVDCTVTSNIRNGTYTKPFKNIQEAIVSILTSKDNYKTFRITLLKTGNYGGIYLQENKTSLEIVASSGTTPTVDFININHCHNILFNGITVNTDKNIYASYTLTSGILVTNSVLIDFMNCNLGVTSNSGLDSVLSTRRSLVYLNNTNFTGTPDNYINASELSLIYLNNTTNSEISPKYVASSNSNIYLGGQILTNRMNHNGGSFYPTLISPTLSATEITNGTVINMDTNNILGTALSERYNTLILSIVWNNQKWFSAISTYGTGDYSISFTDDSMFKTLVVRFTISYTNKTITITKCNEITWPSGESYTQPTTQTATVSIGVCRFARI